MARVLNRFPANRFNYLRATAVKNMVLDDLGTETFEYIDLDVGQDKWILSGGEWNDSGVWDDENVWQD